MTISPELSRRLILPISGWFRHPIHRHRGNGSAPVEETVTKLRNDLQSFAPELLKNQYLDLDISRRFRSVLRPDPHPWAGSRIDCLDRRSHDCGSSGPSSTTRMDTWSSWLRPLVPRGLRSVKTAKLLSHRIHQSTDSNILESRDVQSPSRNQHPIIGFFLLPSATKMARRAWIWNPRWPLRHTQRHLLLACQLIR